MEEVGLMGKGENKVDKLKTLTKVEKGQKRRRV